MASCRACGGEMQPIAICPACEENVQWKCSACNKETDVSVHTHDGRITGPIYVDAYRKNTFATAA